MKSKIEELAKGKNMSKERMFNDNLKISLFERRAVEVSGQEEERVITSITRYVQEHLAEEVSE